MGEGLPDWFEEIIGSVIGGRYLVEELIGKGGMGAVFAGTHQKMGRRVALKLLVPELQQHPKALKRFQIEARAAASANRRGVVDILDYDTDPAYGPFLVMEMLDGESLEQRIRRNRRFTRHEVLSLAAEILDTLSGVHEHNIIHRDLKPANIFLAKTEDGTEQVKVLDFGISRVVSLNVQTQLTTPGMAVGTPRYMAPEQAQCDPDVDPRADIYSLGAILYEMLGGIKPFANVPPREVLAAVLLRSPRELRQISPGLDEHLYDLVEKAMKRDRHDRFRSAGEMLEVVKRLQKPQRTLPTIEDTQSGEFIPSTKVVRNTPVPTQTQPDQRISGPPQTISIIPDQGSQRSAWNRWWIFPIAAVVGAFIVSGLIVGGLFLSRWYDEEPPRTATTPQSVSVVPPTSSAPSPLPSGGRSRGQVASSAVIPSFAKTAVRNNQMAGVVAPSLSLRAELETAKAMRGAGEIEAARASLRKIFNLEHTVRPETADGAVVSEAHLMFGDLLVSTMSRPNPPRDDFDFVRLTKELNALYSQALGHSKKAVIYTTSAAACADFSSGKAAEKIADIYLQMRYLPAYRERISAQNVQFMSTSSRDHFNFAQQFYFLAAKRITPGSDHCREQSKLRSVGIKNRLSEIHFQ